jgi:hypothetical protein
LEATAGNILQVSERLKNEVLDPLLMVFADAPVFMDVLNNAKAVVDRGQTWFVEQLHGVLQQAIKVGSWIMHLVVKVLMTEIS